MAARILLPQEGTKGWVKVWAVFRGMGDSELSRQSCLQRSWHEEKTKSWKTKRGNSLPRQQQRQLQGRSGGRCVTTAVLHQQLVQALGKTVPCSITSPGPWAEAPSWTAPKVCPTLLQRDEAGWRGWALGPRGCTFWVVLHWHTRSDHI